MYAIGTAFYFIDFLKIQLTNGRICAILLIVQSAQQQLHIEV